jgi:hypothetical protein
MLGAFPNVATADRGAFEFVQQLPMLERLRDYLRRQTREALKGTAAELDQQFAEIEGELRNTAEAAAKALSSAIRSRRRKVFIPEIVTAVQMCASFPISSGQELIPPAVGLAFRVALNMMLIDPKELLRTEDLALLVLHTGRRPGAKG